MATHTLFDSCCSRRLLQIARPTLKPRCRLPASPQEPWMDSPCMGKITRTTCPPPNTQRVSAPCLSPPLHARARRYNGRDRLCNSIIAYHSALVRRWCGRFKQSLVLYTTGGWAGRSSPPRCGGRCGAWRLRRNSSASDRGTCASHARRGSMYASIGRRRVHTICHSRRCLRRRTQFPHRGDSQRLHTCACAAAMHAHGT